MNPERRLFLSRSASAVFGLAAVAGLRAAEGTSAAATLPAFDQRDSEAYWNAVRAQYLMAPGLAYFNTGGLGPTPRPVLETLQKAVAQALKSPQVLDAYAKQNVRAQPTASLDEAKSWSRAEIASWEKITKEIKIDLTD